jgi:hypothetical protein
MRKPGGEGAEPDPLDKPPDHNPLRPHPVQTPVFSHVLFFLIIDGFAKTKWGQNGGGSILSSGYSRVPRC